MLKIVLFSVWVNQYRSRIILDGYTSSILRKGQILKNMSTSQFYLNYFSLSYFVVFSTWFLFQPQISL